MRPAHWVTSIFPSRPVCDIWLFAANGVVVHRFNHVYTEKCCCGMCINCFCSCSLSIIQLMLAVRESERQYVNSLTVLDTQYQQPMKMLSAFKHDILSLQQLQFLFLNWSVLTACMWNNNFSVNCEMVGYVCL